MSDTKKKKKKDTVDSTVVTSIEKIAAPEDIKAYILFLSGPLQGKLYELENGRSVIGRADDVNIPINDSRVSRYHFQITVTPGEAILEDLGSTNGTYVNGQRAHAHQLKSGDKIQISSSTIIKFAFGDAGERMFHDEIYNLANLDAATNVYNKQFFLKRYEEEFAFAKRSDKGMSLLMMDIDHFKNVNDTYGHMAGDFVLNHIARKIQNTIRDEDVMARYGGEEFVVILREIGEEGAYQLAERVRNKVCDVPIEFEGNQIPISISIGVASLEDKSIESPKVLLAAADEMLYISKESGRNRTTSTHHKP
jgi:two-component system cell cycle response regulator